MNWIVWCVLGATYVTCWVVNNTAMRRAFNLVEGLDREEECKDLYPLPGDIGWLKWLRNWVFTFEPITVLITGACNIFLPKTTQLLYMQVLVKPHHYREAERRVEADEESS